MNQNQKMVVVAAACMTVVMLAAPIAHAQAYKCKDSAGKVTYQSVPCEGGQAINTQGTAGVTGLKEDADRMKAREQQQRADAAFNPNACQFQYHLYGDELGKTLAIAAKDECLSTKGQQGPAYTRWRDHFQVTSANRNSAASRTQQPAPMMGRQPATPPMRCRANAFGGMDCTPSPY